MWRFAMQHHPGNIHQSFATPRYSATPCYVLIQVPNVIETISKRWRSKKAFNFFCSSGLADVALRLGPNMSISKTQIQSVHGPNRPHKRRQIKFKPETPTTKPRRSANPPARFAFRQKDSKPDTERGKSPNTNTHEKRFAKDTAVENHCVLYKNMQT